MHVHTTIITVFSLVHTKTLEYADMLPQGIVPAAVICTSATFNTDRSPFSNVSTPEIAFECIRFR